MPVRQYDPHDPAWSAIRADASAVCAERLTRVAGTHALLLDGVPMPVPQVAGVARWTVLSPDLSGTRWQGPLRASLDALPFGDESFCAVLVRFPAHAGVVPDVVAPELARLLAPHGTLLVADLHPHSLWHAGSVPGRWEHALRAVGLEVSPAVRCGSPWPRARGSAGMPDWLARGIGGAWVVAARRRTLAAIPLRKAAARRTVEHRALLPGARRQCA